MSDRRLRRISVALLLSLVATTLIAGSAGATSTHEVRVFWRGELDEAGSASLRVRARCTPPWSVANLSVQLTQGAETGPGNTRGLQPCLHRALDPSRDQGRPVTGCIRPRKLEGDRFLLDLRSHQRRPGGSPGASDQARLAGRYGPAGPVGSDGIQQRIKGVCRLRG